MPLGAVFGFWWETPEVSSGASRDFLKVVTEGDGFPLYGNAKREVWNYLFAMTQSRVQPRHGLISEPASRANIYLPEWQSAGLESGKFFPQTQGGLADPYASDDVYNDVPPVDGKIASAGLDYAAELDRPGSEWQKHPVSSGQNLPITWSFHAPHKTRRWNYFITREGWDPTAPLSRAQFEPRPFHQVQLNGQPYWAADDLLPENPTRHELTLPRRQGYHVLLSVWEVADTAKGFYQVIDLEFTG